VAFAFLPLPGDIPVLMYHFIDTPERAAQEKNVVSQKRFAQHMDFLDRFGYRVLTLDEYYEIKTGQREPRGREVLITFDDGNYTFDEQAFSILQEHEFPVAVFVVSESVKRGLHGSMSARTLRKLIDSELVTIGSHSKTHPLLSQMPEEKIEEELYGSRRDLQKFLDVPIDYLAYPSGDVDERVVKAARQSGYKLAFTTSYKKLENIDVGAYRDTPLLYAIPRVKISRTSDFPLAFWGKISGIYQGFKANWYRLRQAVAVKFT